MRKTLVLSAVCAVLLLMSFSARDVAALEYLGSLLGTGYYYLEHGKYTKASIYFGKDLLNDPENADALVR